MEFWRQHDRTVTTGRPFEKCFVGRVQDALRDDDHVMILFYLNNALALRVSTWLLGKDVVRLHSLKRALSTHIPRPLPPGEDGCVEGVRFKDGCAREA